MTIVPELTAILEDTTSRLLMRVRRATKPVDVVVQPGPELRLSLIALRSKEVAELRAESAGAFYLWTLIMAQRDKVTGLCEAIISRLAALAGTARSSIHEWMQILDRRKFITTELRPATDRQVIRTRGKVMVRLATARVPPTVAEQERRAMEEGDQMEPSTGNDVVSKNRKGVVYLRRALVPLALLTSPQVRAAARGGNDFHVWLYLQVQTWARPLRMSSRYIAEELHLLSREVKHQVLTLGGGCVRGALMNLRSLGLVKSEGVNHEPKRLSTPETLHLQGAIDQSEVAPALTPALPAVSEPVRLAHEPYARRIGQAFFEHLQHTGVQRDRPELTAAEADVAMQMAIALRPLEERHPDDTDPVWLSKWRFWFYDAWNRWRGRKPAVLTALADSSRPDWLP